MSAPIPTRWQDLKLLAEVQLHHYEPNPWPSHCLRAIEEIATLEAQVATAIAMRDLEERNKIDFIQQLERSEAQNRQLREALQTFVDHFGDPFKTARAALAATEPPAQTSSIESTYRERE